MQGARVKVTIGLSRKIGFNQRVKLIYDLRCTIYDVRFERQGQAKKLRVD